MALTLQRKLELAGDLSKVQPLLRRLHVLREPEPKKRRKPRSFEGKEGVLREEGNS